MDGPDRTGTPEGPTVERSSSVESARDRRPVVLDEPVPVTAPPAANTREADRAVRQALALLRDDPAVTRLGLDPAAIDRAATSGDARTLLRHLLTVRPAGPRPAGLDERLDALLAWETEHRGIVDVLTVPTVADRFTDTTYPAATTTAVWRGDITRLRCDAITNAANSAMEGCFVAGHACIDNAIHSAAGPRLRDDCHRDMQVRGRPEATGTSMITRGHHLPATYVLHTVGPVVRGEPTDEDAALLASSYRACLDLAAEVDAIRTVALCSISTGLFGYPMDAAAQVALASVAQWFEANPGRLDRVVFDVFSADDELVVADAISTWRAR